MRSAGLGQQRAMELTFGSSSHGAGRRLARRVARLRPLGVIKG